MAIFVQATINMQGIARGQIRRVNPDVPWVKENLATGLLVQVTKAGAPVPKPPEPEEAQNEGVAE